jgi:pilus assembly protein CpaB
VQAVVAGTRVDVLVTTDRRDSTPGVTRLALQNVAVLAARALPATDAARQPRVLATLQVSAANAVFLAAAQSFAADIRLLARAPGDTARLRALTVDDGL